jgi:hypothetical protein
MYVRITLMSVFGGPSNDESIDRSLFSWHFYSVPEAGSKSLTMEKYVGNVENRKKNCDFRDV